MSYDSLTERRSADTNTVSPLPPGAWLQDGTFQIEAVLGRGGFGVTYLASDTTTGKPVAIKEYYPQGCLRRGNTVVSGDAMTCAAVDTGMQRFLQEAKTLCKFDHPGIVHVLAGLEQSQYRVLSKGLAYGALFGLLIGLALYLPSHEAFLTKVGGSLMVTFIVAALVGGLSGMYAGETDPHHYLR